MLAVEGPVAVDSHSQAAAKGQAEASQQQHRID